MVNVDTVSEPTALTLEYVIAPVDVFKVQPEGKEPEETENVIVSPSGSVAPHKSLAAIVPEPLTESNISNLYRLRL